MRSLTPTSIYSKETWTLTEKCSSGINPIGMRFPGKIKEITRKGKIGN